MKATLLVFLVCALLSANAIPGLSYIRRSSKGVERQTPTEYRIQEPESQSENGLQRETLDDPTNLEENNMPTEASPRRRFTSNNSPQRSAGNEAMPSDALERLMGQLPSNVAGNLSPSELQKIPNNILQRFMGDRRREPSNSMDSQGITNGKPSRFDNLNFESERSENDVPLYQRRARDQYPESQNQFPQSENQYPRPLNQYPESQSQYPQPPNQYPESQSQYPQPPNQYPKSQSQYPQPPNQYPESQSQYQDLHNHYPEAPNQYLDALNQYPVEIQTSALDKLKQFAGIINVLANIYRIPRADATQIESVLSGLTSNYSAGTGFGSYLRGMQFLMKNQNALKPFDILDRAGLGKLETLTSLMPALFNPLVQTLQRIFSELIRIVAFVIQSLQAMIEKMMKYVSSINVTRDRDDGSYSFMGDQLGVIIKGNVANELDRYMASRRNMLRGQSPSSGIQYPNIASQYVAPAIESATRSYTQYQQMMKRSQWPFDTLSY